MIVPNILTNNDEGIKVFVLNHTQQTFLGTHESRKQKVVQSKKLSKVIRPTSLEGPKRTESNLSESFVVNKSNQESLHPRSSQPLFDWHSFSFLIFKANRWAIINKATGVEFIHSHFNWLSQLQ